MKALKTWGGRFYSLLTILFVGSATTAVVESVHADTAYASPYDSELLPTDAADIDSGLKAAVDNPVELYALIRQAGWQGYEDAAYRQMLQLASQYPQNADVLASLCFAHDVISGQYDINKNKRLFQKFSFPSC